MDSHRLGSVLLYGDVDVIPRYAVLAGVVMFVHLET